MSFQGRQWLRRIEWRLAIEYGRAYGDSDVVWLRGIEDAWEIIRTLHEKGRLTNMFEVIDLHTDESHGKYETLEKARGCVRFDRLRAYSIWHGRVRVECCDPYTGDDDRVKQATGEPNASEN
jgi:hypothetical protein